MCRNRLSNELHVCVCVCVCVTHRLCMESQSGGFVCVGLGIGCALSHSELCLFVCAAIG